MIKDLINQIEAIKQQLYSKINELPDNTNIVRLEGEPKCFIIKASQLIGNPFSVEYHDYKAQYRFIIEYLKWCKIENFESHLNDIIKTGIVRIDRRSIRLNPEVVNYLSSVI